ncbi:MULTISPECIES: TetR/AcrR family transcriptional regulator [unclassified Burkholderia]|uniref:TetR/AcrR family transcriptional regulator n=1 Tax=unclassified Burkholderia TaxID=2613784 RepID=UPI001D0FB0CA|nr:MULTISPECIES: TetR/AcrR family transcriptional regulator [unclassified Burkholderia]
MNAAIDLLHTVGYSGATTLAIRKAAAVSMGAMQHQFPTKAELMAAAQEQLISARLMRIQEAAQNVADPLQRIERLLDVAGELIGTPLFAASMEIELARRSDPELDRAIAAVHGRFTDGFSNLSDGVIEAVGSPAGETVKRVEWLTGAVIRGLTVKVVTGGDLGEVTAAFHLWRELAIRLITEGMRQPVPKQNIDSNRNKTGKRRSAD